MKPGNLYELLFSYEEGQGSKQRPVLIIVISSEGNKALGLKITKTPPNSMFPHRIKIENSPQANLKHISYIQYDIYEWFDNSDMKPRGKLSTEDFKRIVRAFTDYHEL